MRANTTKNTTIEALGHPVLRVVIERILLGFVSLFFVSLIIFASFSMLPGDFAQSILGQQATQETVAAFRRELGLDQPAYIRYFNWLSGLLQGDFGSSFSGRMTTGGDRSRQVVDLVGPRLANTLFLASVSAAIAIPLSLGLGFLAALYRNSLFDRLINAVSLTTISMPEFFLGYVLILLLASLWPIFPSLANLNDDMTLLEKLWRVMLPALTLTLVTLAHTMRMTRASIINLLAAPYVEMARLKGLRPFRVVAFHILPNAWAPIATVVASNLAYLVVGVVVVEAVFVYPGIGQLMVDAVSLRDIPVVQTCGLVFAATYIFLNMLVDIVALVTNPRLLHPK